MPEHKSHAVALCAAQAEMPNAAFDSVNPHFKNRYASLASLRAASKDILSKHGLVISHHLKIDPVKGYYLRGVLTHAATNQETDSEFALPDKSSPPQVIKSAVTYGTRTTWAALVGIAAEEDDDGEQASRGPTKSAYQARKDGFYPIAQEQLRAMPSLTAMKEWWKKNQDEIKALPANWIALLEEEKDRRKLQLADEQTEELKQNLKGSLAMTPKDEEVIDESVTPAAWLDDLDGEMSGAKDAATILEIWHEHQGIKDGMPAADQEKAEVIFNRHHRRAQADAAVGGKFKRPGG